MSIQRFILVSFALLCATQLWVLPSRREVKTGVRSEVIVQEARFQAPAAMRGVRPLPSPAQPKVTTDAPATKKEEELLLSDNTFKKSRKMRRFRRRLKKLGLRAVQRLGLRKAAVNRAENTAEHANTLPAITYERYELASSRLDPIIPSTGEMVYEYPIISNPGVGMGFELVLTYRSGYEYDGPLSDGWDHNWNRRFIFNSALNQFTLIQANRLDIYPNDTGNFYSSPTGSFELEVEKGIDDSKNAVFRRLQDGTREVYCEVNSGSDVYFLDRVEHRDSDNKITLTYDPMDINRLATITDTRGTEYVFEYNSNDHISSIEEDPDTGASRDWILSYSTSTPYTLDSIEGPSVSSVRRKTEFTYTVPTGSRELLATVTAPREEDASGPAYLQMEYDSISRVTRQVFGVAGAGVQDYEVSYGTNSTTETARDGTDYVYHFTGTGASRQMTHMDVTDGSTTFRTYYTWNSDALIETMTHPIKTSTATSGGGYLYLYSDGRVTASVHLADNVSATGYSGSTTIVDMRGSADCLVTEYQYQTTSTWVLLNVISDPLDKDWTLGRDTLGNVTSLTTPLHTSDPWVIAYDANSRPTSVTDPESRVTSFEYFTSGSGQKGLLKKVRVDPTGLNLATEYGRDRWGNVTKVTDAESNDWTYTYNDRNLVTTSKTPLLYETDYSYDLNNCLTKVEVDHDNGTMSGTTFTTEYEYNVLDRVTKVKQYGASATARVWTYTYDKEERVVTVESPEGREVETEYDFRGLATERTVAPGTTDATTTTYTYTDESLVSTVTNGNSWVTEMQYDDFLRHITTVDGEDHISESIYDKNGNRNWSCKRTSTSPVEFPLSFDGSGNLDKQVLSASKLVEKTYTGYDVNNQQTITIRYAHEWDSASAGLLPTAPGNQLTSNMYYDKAGIMTRMTEPCGCGGGTGVLHLLDAAGRVTTSGDEEGNVTTYTLDKLGRATLVKREEKQATPIKTFWMGYSYDVDGRVVTVRQQAAATPNSSNDLITTFEYDGQGRRVTVTDPNGNYVRYEHDDYGRMEKTFISVGASSEIEQIYAYDQDSLVTAVTAVRTGVTDGVTSYVYDNAGRVKEELDESRSTSEGKELYTYDSAGLLSTVTQRNGTVCTLTYEKRGLVTKRAYTSVPVGVVGPSAETYEYDARGNMWFAHNSDALVLREWNSIGKLNREYQYVKEFDATSVSSVGAGGKRRDLSYDFDDNGLVSEVNYPDNSHLVSYAYDDINQITGITKTIGAVASPITEWDMQGPGRAIKLTHGNDVQEDMTYDEFGRLTTLEWDRPVGASRVSLFEYTRGYDKGSRPVFEQREFWGSGATPTKLTGAQDFGDVYQYDRANRLTAVHRGVGYHTGAHTLPSTFDPTGTGLNFYRKATYDLDETGNRKELDIDSSDNLNPVADFRDEVGAHGDDNELSSLVVTDYVASSTITKNYTWDKNGTLTNDPDLTGSFEVDVHNRIRTFGDYIYRYDALGRRVAKDNGTSTELDSVSRRFYYDGMRCVQEFESHVVDDGGEGTEVCSMNTPVWTRIYGPFLVDQILWGLQKTLEYDDVTGCEAIVSEQEMFFALDILGSAIALTDAETSVGVIEQYRYEEYGAATVLAGDGSTVRSLSAWDQKFGFTGRRKDFETQVMYYRARSYSPARGGFMSRDLLMADFPSSSLAYASWMPNALVDPTGLAAIKPDAKKQWCIDLYKKMINIHRTIKRRLTDLMKDPKGLSKLPDPGGSRRKNGKDCKLRDSRRKHAKSTHKLKAELADLTGHYKGKCGFFAPDGFPVLPGILNPSESGGVEPFGPEFASGDSLIIDISLGGGSVPALVPVRPLPPAPTGGPAPDPTAELLNDFYDSFPLLDPKWGGWPQRNIRRAPTRSWSWDDFRIIRGFRLGYSILLGPSTVGENIRREAERRARDHDVLLTA